MKPIIWDPTLTTKKFTKQLRRLADKSLSELDMPKIAKSLYELNWADCSNCVFDCEKNPCPFPYNEVYLIITINETLPKDHLHRRVFRFEASSDSNSGFCIQLVEGDMLVAATNEIEFSDYIGEGEARLQNTKK